MKKNGKGKDALTDLLQSFPLLIVSGACFAFIAFLLFNITVGRQYESDALLYVMVSDSQDQRIVSAEDCARIIAGEAVLEQSVADLGMDTTLEEIRKKLVVTPVSNGNMIMVTVKSRDPYEAQDIAEAISQNAQRVIVEIMNYTQVQIVEPASLSARAKTAPEIWKYVILAGLAGVLLMSFLIVKLSLYGSVLRTPDEIENLLELPVLGVVGDTKETKHKKRKTIRKEA